MEAGGGGRNSADGCRANLFVPIPAKAKKAWSSFNLYIFFGSLVYILILFSGLSPRTGAIWPRNLDLNEKSYKIWQKRKFLTYSSIIFLFYFIAFFISFQIKISWQNLDVCKLLPVQNSALSVCVCHRFYASVTVNFFYSNNIGLRQPSKKFNNDIDCLNPILEPTF
jgi:hypothetical protein